MLNPDPEPAPSVIHTIPFFVTGGTLPLTAASYVARAADEDLYQSLRRGEFCYVLNTRQMGKSSLMIRTARRLRTEGRRVLILDLTGVGQNLSVEQWYFGLLDLAAMQTECEDELVAFWKSHKELGPMQRFVGALRRILLAPQSATDSARELIIFIDEIDAVRSLPFSADEFFAGIRECYNRNAQEPSSRHLIFCLLGVATPSDLIQDTRVTPFNIGKRIELHDFTWDEAMPLAEGLGRYRDAIGAEALLERVLFWTGGHPYMTQRLCRAVADNLALNSPDVLPGKDVRPGKIEDAALVDTLCRSLFLAKAVRETDDNLAFVRTRLLHSEEDRASLLDLYTQVRRGKWVRDEETNALCAVLRLSGVAKTSGGRLVLRNEIYTRVFDTAWIAEHMPDAEVRRQKRAYRLGVFRAAGVFGSLAMVIGILLLVAVRYAQRAHVAESEARKQARATSQLLYDSNMLQLQRDWEQGYYTIASGLLEETRLSPARNFEWSYWHRLHNEYAPPLPGTGHGDAMIAPDNRTLGEIMTEERGSEKGRFTARDISTGKIQFSLPARSLSGQELDYAPDGSRLLLAVGRSVEVRDAQTGRWLQTVPARQEELTAFHFTADGSAILVARLGGGLELWDSRTEKTRWEQKLGGYGVIEIAVSDKVAVTMSDRRTNIPGQASVIQVWDLRTGRELYRNDRDFESGALAFSPDAHLLVGALHRGGIVMLDMSMHTVRAVAETSHKPFSFHFSSDGSRLTAGYATNLCAYAMPSGRRLTNPPRSRVRWSKVYISPNGRFALRAEEDDKYHFIRTDPVDFSQRLSLPVPPPSPFNGKVRRAPLGKVCYSPDGRKLAVASSDGNVYLWEPTTGKLLQVLSNNGVRTIVAVFSHGGSLLALGDYAGAVSLWDLTSGKRLIRFPAHITPDTNISGQTGAVNDVSFSADDRQLITAGDDFTAKIWDISGDNRTTVRLNRTLQGHKMAVECVALSPDGMTILTGSDDKAAKLWDLRTGNLLATFKAPAEIWGEAFSPDGKRIALGNLMNNIQVWDIGTKQRIQILSGHTDWITEVAFSPDGERILSGSRDNTAKLWDAQTGRELLTFRGHTKQILGLAFAPDGSQIATTSQDGEVRLWNTRPDTADATNALFSP